MSDEYTPEAICNMALDQAGVDFTIGSLQEGSRAAQVCLRFYSKSVEQMLRGALWNFARKQADLELLLDATGQEDGLPTDVPGPFLYGYAMPIDCLRVRYIPARYWDSNPPAPDDNIVPEDNDAPIMPNMIVGPPRTVMPTRFLVTSDQTTAGGSNDTPGLSPIGRTLILSNQQDALVAYIAAQIAMPLTKDKKFGLQMRNTNIAIAQASIANARKSNGQESWADSGLAVDWMTKRNTGGSAAYWGGFGTGGPGYLWGGVDDLGFGGLGNTSAY